MLERHPETLVFGEDVAAKGGVYGVTRGLQARFGERRVFDTLLDETTILGVALGTAVSGFVPIPEIQYLAYLHNAEDRPRRGGDIAVLLAGRVPQRDGRARPGLRLPEGLRRALPQRQRPRRPARHPRPRGRVARATGRRGPDAPHLRGAAKADGSVCVFLEPIALYHTCDLFEEGDDLWLGAPGPSTSPSAPRTRTAAATT